ncbi:MAG: RNA 2',3'-cyclic phosphodiesterase [Bacteroidales bacterium]|nr:RNA 2',3'-cyclic phosphodiesterase [Bacteroidales bacterium]
MKRLFAAIKVEPDENLIETYDKLKSGLRDEKINWVPERNIHITLKFFGETPEDKTDGICEVLDDIAREHNGFEIQLQNIGVFGSSYNPRVIWFGMDQNAALESLANDVLGGAEKLGWERDRQNFRPHLTVGRIKSIKEKRFFQQTIDKFKNSKLQAVPVQSFYLIESKLRAQGPVYEIVEEFRLG